MSRRDKLLLALIALVLLSCLATQAHVEAVAHLAIGWGVHLVRVVPRVTIAWPGVALFAAMTAIALRLAHGTARWLWNDPARPWRWKWTLLGGAGVLLMFASGIAATGVVHQVGWMARSPVPLVRDARNREARNRVRCMMNLREIGEALTRYAARNDGYVPRTRAGLAALAPRVGLRPETFVCPMSEDSVELTTGPSDWPAMIDPDRHFSYVVAPADVRGPDGVRGVWMYEPLDNHGDGTNVLYDDGKVQWLDMQTAAAWLAARPASRPSTRPEEGKR